LRVETLQATSAKAAMAAAAGRAGRIYRIKSKILINYRVFNPVHPVYPCSFVFEGFQLCSITPGGLFVIVQLDICTSPPAAMIL
jgi:hypothetical protein